MKKTFWLLIFGAFSVQLFSLNPRRGYDFTPADFGMTYEEVSIKTSDDLKLTGWLLTPLSKSKKCMIFSHSGEGNMQDFIESAASFVSLGYNVLMYDYRGYGTSDEFNISSKFYIYSQFALDVTAAIDWVRKYKAVFSIDMYGAGIGAGLSVAIAANRDEVNYVIGDGTYASFERVQNAWKAANDGEKILMPLGYDKVYMEPLFALESKGNHLEGILLIISDNDKIVTTEDADLLRQLRKKQTTIYQVPSTGNDMNFETDKDTYFNEVKDFLGA